MEWFRYGGRLDVYLESLYTIDEVKYMEVFYKILQLF
jgi:hypothetical protein